MLSVIESSTTLTQQSPKNTNSQVTADMKSAERRQEETDGASENPKVKKIRVCSDVGEDPEVSSVNTGKLHIGVGLRPNPNGTFSGHDYP